MYIGQDYEEAKKLIQKEGFDLLREEECLDESKYDSYSVWQTEDEEIDIHERAGRVMYIFLNI